MDPVVSDVSKAALLSITCDVVTNLAEANQLFDAEVNQTAEPFPFMALYRRLQMKVLQLHSHSRYSALATVENGATQSCEVT